MLIFIHGMWSNEKIWKPYIKHFENRNFECKAIYLKENMDLKRTFFIDYVNKIKSMAGENDILIGHSMGGLIVQKVMESKKVKGGVAICSAPPKGIKFRNFSMTLYSLKYLPNIIFKKPFKPSYNFMRKFILNCINEERAKEIYKGVEAEAPNVAYELAMNKIEVDERKVKDPLLFIAMKDDKASPPQMIKKIAEKYNAEYKLLDGCHWIFEKWENVAEEISKFILKIF